VTLKLIETPFGEEAERRNRKDHDLDRKTGKFLFWPIVLKNSAPENRPCTWV